MYQLNTRKALPTIILALILICSAMLPAFAEEQVYSSEFQLPTFVLKKEQWTVEFIALDGVTIVKREVVEPGATVTPPEGREWVLDDPAVLENVQQNLTIMEKPAVKITDNETQRQMLYGVMLDGVFTPIAVEQAELVDGTWTTQIAPPATFANMPLSSWLYGDTPETASTPLEQPDLEASIYTLSQAEDIQGDFYLVPAENNAFFTLSAEASDGTIESIILTGDRDSLGFNVVANPDDSHLEETGDPDDEAAEDTGGEEDEAAETEPVARDITIASDIPDVLHKGDTITLTAVLTGYDDVQTALQWQYDDGSGWQDAPGETGVTCTFEASPITLSYRWRVNVTVVE